MVQPDEPKPVDPDANQRGVNDMSERMRLATERMTMDYRIVFDVPPDAETQPAEPDQPR